MASSRERDWSDPKRPPPLENIDKLQPSGAIFSFRFTFFLLSSAD